VTSKSGKKSPLRQSDHRPTAKYISIINLLKALSHNGFKKFWQTQKSRKGLVPKVFSEHDDNNQGKMVTLRDDARGGSEF
jgi:hypothetical protein